MIEKIINRIKYRLDENTSTAEVIKKRGYEGEIIIPKSVKDPVKKRGCKGSGGKEYSVNSIAESAFEGCSSLTSITIPDSVTSIGVHAFNGCISLKTIQYDGTWEQNKITLEDEWNKKVPAKVINCTDGSSVDILPNALQQNPMYRLSMSSLELFHSNFLEWLFDIDHEAFLKCFGPRFTNPAACTIEREYHLGTTEDKQWVTDIAVFENGNLILIIENKIKSTPSKGQLKYQSELANKLAQQKTADAANEETDTESLCKKVLLSLFEYSVLEDKPDGFDKVLYKELCGQIRHNYDLHPQFDPYIEDYCKMLERLQVVIDEDSLVKDWKDGHYTAHMFSKKLEIYDMMDAFRKYQAASLVDKFKKLINPQTGTCEETGILMTCEHSLNNKRACATISYELIPGKLCVGVQVEQDQLRVFFENRDKNKEFNIRKADAYWNAWLVKPLGTGKEGKAYCSYSDSFIYRYVKLDSKPINIGELCDRVKEYLKKISENRNDIVKDLLSDKRTNIAPHL